MSWLLVEWTDGIGISYESKSKVSLLEENKKWEVGSRVKQTYNKELYIGKILSTWETKAAAVQEYDRLLKPRNELPDKRKVKLTEKAKDKETHEGISRNLESVFQKKAPSTSSEMYALEDLTSSDSEALFDEEKEAESYIAGLKRKTQGKQRKEATKRQKRVLLESKPKNQQGKDSDDEHSLSEAEPLDSCVGDEGQKENVKFAVKKKAVQKRKGACDHNKTKQDDANKKVAEVKNLKKLLTSTAPISPKPVQSEAPCSPMQPLRSPLHSLTPPGVNMFYTECDGCKKLERKLEKLEEDFFRIKKFLQKSNSAALKAEAGAKPAVRLVTEGTSAVETEKAGDDQGSLTKESTELDKMKHPPQVTRSSDSMDVSSGSTFMVPADAVLRAEVSASRSAGVAERSLLCMMFPMETLKISSVMGRKIKKDEPARPALDKHLLNKLIEMIKEQWPTRSEQIIINSLNTKLKEIRLHTSEDKENDDNNNNTSQ